MTQIGSRVFRLQRITISPQQRQGSQLLLEADQVHYLIRVLRLNAGDRFVAQDGQGQQWLAAITAQPHQAYIIETIVPSRAAAPLRLVAALPKGNHFDQVVRQTTELGVTHIHPVLTERTLLRPSDHKLSRWQRIAQEASEQSERVTVPQIFAPLPFQQYLQQSHQTETGNDELRYLCAARAAGEDGTSAGRSHLLAHLQAHLTSAHSPGITVAIGPEGGWTAAEITDAITCGYEAVSLGAVILRAVTAPVTALSLVSAARELLV